MPAGLVLASAGLVLAGCGGPSTSTVPTPTSRVTTPTQAIAWLPPSPEPAASGAPMPPALATDRIAVARTGGPAAHGSAGHAGAEAEALRLTNAERTRAGCPPLRSDPVLTRVARAHSRDMATHRYFDHTDVSGASPFDRITAAGYRYRAAAENIAAGQATAEAVVRDWMLSPDHRATILDCSLREVGIGLYLSADERYPYLWTQDFATPR